MLDSQRDRDKKVKLALFLYKLKVIDQSVWTSAINIINMRSILRTLSGY